MAFTPFPSYNEVGHGYIYSDEEFGYLRPQIQSLCGKPLTGFSGEYAALSVRVPDFVMNEANTKLVDNAFAKIARLKAEEPQKPSNLFSKDTAGNETSWASQFNSKPVPVGRFQAYYFNTKNPDTVLGTELVDRVSIKYAWSDFLDIDSNDFGAYYVGDFKFDSDTVRNISLAQDYSFTRVLIDRKVVFDESDHNSGMLSYTFKKGTHRIEVEHINDWHTVGFSADFAQLPISNEDMMKTYLDKHLNSSTKVYAVLVYEAGFRDMTSIVKLPDVTESDFLVRNSFEPVHWIIDTSGRAKIKGVILSSDSDGSTVTFRGGQSCEVIRAYNTYVSVDVDYYAASISKTSSPYLQISSYLKTLGIAKLDGIANFEDEFIKAGGIKVEP